MTSCDSDIFAFHLMLSDVISKKGRFRDGESVVVAYKNGTCHSDNYVGRRLEDKLKPAASRRTVDKFQSGMASNGSNLEPSAKRRKLGAADRITLDVGGTAFVTAASTLTTNSTYFASLLPIRELVRVQRWR